MLYSHAWLQALVPHGRSPDEIAALIGRHVATVDGVRRLRDDLAPIVVARVVEAARHPNAERLWVTKVDDGSGTLLDVVCGAPNVEVNALYPFARAGTAMPGGLTIERRKIRGETSNGMLCSARELGLGEDHDGIMALSVAAAPGTPFLDAMPVGDVQFDVDVLPNRPDLLSHLGMARELSALTGVACVPDVATGDVSIPACVTGLITAASAGVVVTVDDSEGCPRYMAAVIRGVRVGPSPDWLVQRLAGVGLRTISNVVDVTNYALHGLGQPMHAFDLAKLGGDAVVIRRARGGESLVTLDGVTRTLDEEMTVIADGSRPIAIAGVMGGRESEVTAATQDILLEVANFDPRRVRRTRKTLGLSTDASYRFERGVDIEGAAEALAVAVRALILVASGRLDGAPMDVGRGRTPRAAVHVRASRVSRLLGGRIDAGEIDRLLTGIGFACAQAGDDALMVTPPSWRHDVTRDADVVEEVARLRGYDTLPDDLAAFRPGRVPDDPLVEVLRHARRTMVARGFHEVRPLPFVRGDDATHERVRNPLADDEPHLRLSIMETLARRAEHNLTRMQGDLRLFEVGSVFAPSTAASGGARARPREETHVGALLMGARRPRHFTEPSPPALDEWDAKALGGDLAALLYPGQDPIIADGAEDGLWTIRIGPTVVGRVTRVALDAPVWAAPAFGVEISAGPMPNADVAAPGAHAHDATPATRTAAFRAYRPIPATPAAEFDLALIVPDTLTAAECARVLRASAGDLLERLELFDEFRGKGIPEGARSLAWRLTFRDPARTLRDKEVEGRRAKILQTLERELGVRPRSV